jgi:DNA-binding MarR family transcriptional regulator
VKVAPKRASAPAKTRRIHQAIEQLAMLVDVFERRRDTLAAEAGVTVEQWRVMEEIGSRRFMPSMFARRRESSAAAVSRILRQLLDANLVSVAISQSDGRNREYRLTPAGERVLADLKRSREAAIESVWMAQDASEIGAFTEFAKKLVDAIEQYSRRDGASRTGPSGQHQNGTSELRND